MVRAGNHRVSNLRPALWAAVALLAAWPSLLHAQTPRIQGQGAAASGMGNAFTAQADDPSALHYNPAGMTQLRGVQNMFGALLIGGSTSFVSPTGVATTGDRGGSVAWPLPGHFFLTANLKDVGFASLENWTVGVGLTTPFGSLSQYPLNGPFRTAVTFTTLPLLDIKPTIAYKVNEQLSIGLGADIYTFSGLFGEGHVEQQSIWPGGLGIPAGSRVELKGSDTTAGFNISLLYTPFRNADGMPLANIGLVYRSQAVLNLSGQFLANGRVQADATAPLALPSVYSGGFAIWPVRDRIHEWKLELDVDYIGWKANRDNNVQLSTGSRILQPQSWRNTYNVMIGTEYKWLHLERLPEWEIALRGGFTNQQTQVPDFTFNPGIPSADTQIPSVGLGLLCKEQGLLFGFKCGDLGIGGLKPKAIGLDLSYQAAFYEDRTITGNRNPTVDGTYKTLIHVGGFTLRFNY